MDRFRWVFLLLILYFIKTSSAGVKCKNTVKCDCIKGPQSTYEFQCPPRSSEDIVGVVIHIEGNKVLMDCYNVTEQFDLDILPNINATNIKEIRIRLCPLPKNNFKEIIDKFTPQEITSFRFQYRKGDQDVILSKNYFDGLSYLKDLTLANNDFKYLDEDVFESMPNLLFLDLRQNNVILKPKLFYNNTKLKFLDLAGNALDSIPHGLFNTLSNLSSLHLWSNQIERLDDHTFDGLENLTTLELSNNKIEHLSPGALGRLRKLISISLMVNQIGIIPDNFFQNNVHLELIKMSTNPILKMPDFLFSNLTNLKTVHLANCSLDSLPYNLFAGSFNLETLILNYNQIKDLPPTLFEGKSQLKQLDLTKNRLEAVPVLIDLVDLEKLYLTHNSISSIGSHDLSSLIELRELNLAYNTISRIDDLAFHGNSKLRVLNLAHNHYAPNSTGPFNRTPFTYLGGDLEDCDLSHNLITDLIEDFFSTKVKLKKLDLSYNQIELVKFRTLMTVAPNTVQINLAFNNITTIDFDTAEIIAVQNDNLDAYSNNKAGSLVNLANNPIRCDCHLNEAVRYFKGELDPRVRVLVDISPEDLSCASPPIFQNVSLNMIPLSKLVCPFEEIMETYQECPQNCSCYWRPVDKAFIVNCSYQNHVTCPHLVLPNITVLYNHTEMNLEGNQLTNGLPKNPTGYNNVTELVLSRNQIIDLNWVPPKLKVLMIDNNNISRLNYDVLKRINTTNLKRLSVENNPWVCDCVAENFTNFLRQNSKKMDGSDIKCVNSNRFLVDLNNNDLCHETPVAILIIAVMFPILIVAISSAIYFKYKQEIKVYLYAKNLCLWWVTEEELDKDKLFDAFISYSQKDEDFVNENLLPVLEPQYKLLLHYKHWIPGEHITKQIINSVHDSRRTLVVLSPNFLESVWGKMEFRTAHTKAMNEGRTRVIVVLYNDVNIDALDNELKTYLKTNTYVKWGDPFFWNKLKYALPHSKRNIARNDQKLANVMITLDDKFNLVPPTETPEPISTPPVLTLDAGLLKKHPLNFISKTDRDTPPAADAGTLVSNNV